MADLVETENTGRFSRPSLAQVKAVIEYMQKHPDLANRKFRHGTSQAKVRKLWIELSNIANSIEGAIKSTKGWIKFWSDKRRSIIMKQKQIDEGKLDDNITPLENKILSLCSDDKPSATRKRKGVKQEPCNGNNDNDDDSIDGLFKNSDDLDLNQPDRPVTEIDVRQLTMMEKLVEVMNQQSSAMSQMAQASMDNSKALERLAEASHIQALAVDRLANTFDTINASVHDVRNAIMSIDYTMKRCYTATATQHRQNSNIFS